jgi:2-polyprenyl-3-methyl-5-hydroxy-6-metoxy-1,4-benzoquinol methylase
MQREAFDARYFRRFYEKQSTRVHGKKEIARLARGVTGLIAWLGGDVRSVLDVGAGVGLWRDWFKRHRPDVRYRSTDVSGYACEKYGHEQADISSFRAKEKFDLIVCQGVLPYLDDEACSHAIDNLGAMSRGFLYLEAITTRDLKEVCDLDATDVAVHSRAGDWYRERLGRYFNTVGCGLYYARSGGIRFYELEVQTR